MIPVLYESTETTFGLTGTGRLAECVSCTVTEERNGIYECAFQYPVTGRMYDQITEGRIIGCTHDDKGDVQPFDIYGRTAPINGLVTFYARHISYRLRNIVLKPFEAGSCAEALSKFATETYNPNPFTFWTDKVVAANYKVTEPSSAREMLAGAQGSILDVFGKGEYEFDKLAVKLHLNRGTDSGATIRYGVNLTDLTREIDRGSVYNSVIPFWKSPDDGTLVMLPEIVIYGDNVTAANAIIVPLDMSDAFDEQPTEAQLRSSAQSRLANADGRLPKDNIEVDFVALWQTAEYSQFAALQRLGLCDRVTVIYRELGVNAQMQIVRTVYNVLKDRFDEMELGTARASFADLVAEQISDTVLSQYAGKSMMTAAINHATEMITGGLGGYVVFKLNNAGQPEEILIMDTPDTGTAVNVWRFNQGGLAHSSSGYNGPYSDVALTADGQINASLITTGTLLANIIKAGIIADTQNKNSWNLDTGEFNMNGGTIELKAPGSSTFGFYVGPYGDIAMGAKPADMSSFENNKAALQINNQGYIKSNVLYLYGRNSNADDFIKCVRLDGTPGAAQGHPTIFGVYVYDGSGTEKTLLRTNYQYLDIYHDTYIHGNFMVSGTKNRAVKTKSYGTRKLSAYETAEPYFGDIGEAVIDTSGRCVVPIDQVFRETIGDQYQVFLSPYGRGECFVAERRPDAFVVEGNAGLRFGWEVKGKQIDYQDSRLEAMQDDWKS